MKAKNFALNLFEEDQIVFTSAESKTELWHKRIGHFNHDGLLYDLVKGVFTGKKISRLRGLSLWKEM